MALLLRGGRASLNWRHLLWNSGALLLLLLREEVLLRLRQRLLLLLLLGELLGAQLGQELRIVLLLLVQREQRRLRAG